MAMKKSTGRIAWEFGQENNSNCNNEFPYMDICPSCNNKFVFYAEDVIDGNEVCPYCGYKRLFFRFDFNYKPTNNSTENISKDFESAYKKYNGKRLDKK